MSELDDLRRDRTDEEIQRALDQVTSGHIRMCVPVQDDDTDIVLYDVWHELQRLRLEKQQLEIMAAEDRRACNEAIDRATNAFDESLRVVCNELEVVEQERDALHVGLCLIATEYRAEQVAAEGMMRMLNTSHEREVALQHECDRMRDVLRITSTQLGVILDRCRS